MTYFKTVIILLLFFLPAYPAIAGSTVIDKVADGVCNCLQESKKENQSIQTKEFKSCIEKVSKPYAKQLKKMLLEKDEPDAEKKFAEKLAIQLGMSMSSKCPDMLNFILEEFPELQDGN